MKNKIILNAKKNTENKGKSKFIKLNSFSDFDLVIDLMNNEYKRIVIRESLILMKEIEGGVTFGFWFDEKGMLCFDR